MEMLNVWISLQVLWGLCGCSLYLQFLLWKRADQQRGELAEIVEKLNTALDWIDEIDGRG